MEKLLNKLNRDSLEKCLAGTPLDVGLLSEDQLTRAAVVMAHCCLNGPVGVNKSTTFPNGLVGNIKEVLGVPGLSNKSWQTTCQAFGTALKGIYPDICLKCQQTRLNGDIWPLHGKTK